MKKKEYPATHSMWTSWFAIDEDGNVAVMECNDNGPAPVGVSPQTDADALIEDSVIGRDGPRIRFTDEQLMGFMANSISGIEEYQRNPDTEYIFGCLASIEPEKLDLLKAAAQANKNNQLICISERLNLWYIDFSKQEITEDKYALTHSNNLEKRKLNVKNDNLYQRLYTEKVILRLVRFNWPLGYDEEESSVKGYLRKEDVPFPMYFLDYDSIFPAERKLMPHSIPGIKVSQLPDEILNNAVKLPIRFKETIHLQLAKYLTVEFYGDYGYRVDGHNVMDVQFEDGSAYFVGNGEPFIPMPIEEAFSKHHVVLGRECRPEFCINGKRGYFLIENSNSYYRIGTREIIEAKDIKTIEKIDEYTPYD